MNSISKLIDLDSKKKLRIAVIGDAMQDVYVHGRFGTCQEECYKFVEESRHYCQGGSANAAESLSHWNASVALFSNERSIQPVKTRHLVNGKFVFRHDDDQMDVEATMRERRRTELIKLEDCDSLAGVLISDYDKGFLTYVFIRTIIDLANKRNIPIVCDAKLSPATYDGAILKCNKEYADRHLIEMSNRHNQTVITHGDSPPIYQVQYEKWETVGDKTKGPCLNHVGAGDCFAAHLTLALAHGLTLREACEIAHAAGSVYVQHEHNRAPWPYEIRRDLDPVGGKVICSTNSDNLHALRQSEAGRIVFTNGVFDLLGPHHVYMLQKAKEMGGILVVGVNGDSSVSRLKGPSRPVMSLAERMNMLCSLSCVDWVIPFDDNTPSSILEALRPEIRAGGDLPERNRTGDEFAKEVRLIPPMQGLSTTSVMNRINRVAER